VNKLANSALLVKPSESFLLRIEEQILVELARELEKDVHRINPVLMDLILINQHHESLEHTAHGELEIEEDYQDSSPAHQFLHR
jgi:hypothetical protein